MLVATLTDPSQEKASPFGVRARRYTVGADGENWRKLPAWFRQARLKPHVAKVFPLDAAADAMASVEDEHSVVKVVLKVA